MTTDYNSRVNVISNVEFKFHIDISWNNSYFRWVKA